MEKILDIIKNRHSVRKYTDRIIEDEKRAVLDSLASKLNEESGLNIQMIYDEPKCFGSIVAKYGSFSSCNNYIAIVGTKSKGTDEAAGYYGEQLVLKAQELGLNTCWVAVTHGKSQAVVSKDEKLIIIIALGYGENQGVEHKSKSMAELCTCDGEMPDWFKLGMEAAMLAPTALNQQNFRFHLSDDGKVTAKAGGFYPGIDLGIVKYHFEVITGRKVL